MQIVFAICAVAILGTAAVAGRRYWTARELASRPTLVNVREPEMSGAFTCEVTSGLQSNGMQTFIRNVGEAEAIGVFPAVSMTVIPEKDVRTTDFNSVPRGSCRDRPLGVPSIGTLRADQESSPRLPQPSMTWPVLKSPQQRVMLYGVSCAYYSAASGAEHGACDTYRLRVSDGSLTFRCDGRPVTGKFEASLMTNCAD